MFSLSSQIPSGVSAPYSTTPDKGSIPLMNQSADSKT